MEIPTQCPACKGVNLRNLGQIPNSDVFAGRNLLNSIPGGYLFHCNSCLLNFRFPRLSKITMDNLYSEGTIDNWATSANNRVDWRLAHEWIRSVYSQGDILDVGCFDGSFLASLPSIYNLNGIEIHPGAVERAQNKGVKIIGKDFNDLYDYSSCFDIVVAFDVIEHVIDPLKFLNSLVETTRLGGSIIISTGNPEAISWRMMGSTYWYCTIPEHISFISPKWCEINSKKLNLEIEDMVRFSHMESTAVKRIRDIFVNLAYRITPEFVKFLRKQGLGKKDIVKYPELVNYPPAWVSAVDHFIVKFRKRE